MGSALFRAPILVKEREASGDTIMSALRRYRREMVGRWRSRRTSLLRGLSAWVGSYTPLQDPFQYLNQYLAAGLTQHSTSPYSSPLVVVPQKSGGVLVTVNYKKLNDSSRLSQLPIPRVGQVLDSLGTEYILSFFNLVSSFHQITAHKDAVPLTAFCTPMGLYEWLDMPQGSSVSPDWFVKVINEVTEGLEQVPAYLWTMSSCSIQTRQSTSKPFVPSLSDWASTTSSSPPRKPDSA